MKYEKLDNVNGVLTECAVCHNEEIVKDAEYCHICGAPLRNRCSNEKSDDDYYDNFCSKSVNNPIPVNARFCPYCSSPTTFKINRVLNDWKFEETKEIKIEIPF